MENIERRASSVFASAPARTNKELAEFRFRGKIRVSPFSPDR
jgi:hypothetical protein